MRQEMSSKIYSKLEGGKLFNKPVENTKQKFEDTLRAHETLDQQKYNISLNKWRERLVEHRSLSA